MKKHEATIPTQGKVRLTDALERLVQLYEATGKKDEAAKWRKELDWREGGAVLESGQAAMTNNHLLLESGIFAQTRAQSER